jgi:hypothetical protein
MFYHIVWVDMYTPGGSAFGFHFIAHDCQSIEEFRIISHDINGSLYIRHSTDVVDSSTLLFSC